MKENKFYHTRPAIIWFIAITIWSLMWIIGLTIKWKTEFLGMKAMLWTFCIWMIGVLIIIKQNESQYLEVFNDHLVIFENTLFFWHNEEKTILYQDIDYVKIYKTYGYKHSVYYDVIIFLKNNDKTIQFPNVKNHKLLYSELKNRWINIQMIDKKPKWLSWKSF